MRLTLPIVTAFAAIFGGAACASTITTLSFSDSGSYSATSTISDSSTGVTTQTVAAAGGLFRLNQPALALSRFDPTLGTLLSVRLTFTEDDTSTVSRSLTCRDSAFGIGTTTACNRTTSSSATVAVPVQVDIPFDTTDFVPVAENGNVNVSPSRLSAFLGSSDIMIPWRLNTAHTATGRCVPDFPSTITQCSLSSTANFETTFTANVFYTYRAAPPPPPPPSPVPLPASALMLLAALAGLGTARRRAS